MKTIVIDFDSSNLYSLTQYTFRVQCRDHSGNLVGGEEIMVLYTTDAELLLSSWGDGWYGTENLWFSQPGDHRILLRNFTPGLTTQYWTNTDFEGEPAAQEITDSVWASWSDNVGPL